MAKKNVVIKSKLRYLLNIFQDHFHDHAFLFYIPKLIYLFMLLAILSGWLHQY